MKKIAIQIFGTLLVAVMSCYLGCLAYRLAMHGLYSLSASSLIVLHVFGIDLSILQASTMALDSARSNETAMYAAGVVAFCVFAVLAPGQLGRRDGKYPGIVLLTAVTVLFGIGISADFCYGITPLSETAFSDPAYNARRIPVEHQFAVENVIYLPDQLSGVTAEVEGILDYERNMKRFILRSATDKANYVKVYFFKGRRTIFSDASVDKKPRYFALAESFVGRRVRIMGKCVNGQIDADVADMRETKGPPDNGNVSRPLAPL